MSQRQKREVRRKSNMANIAITTAGGPYATSKWIRTFRSILFNLVVSLWYLTSHLCLYTIIHIEYALLSSGLSLQCMSLSELLHTLLSSPAQAAALFPCCRKSRSRHILPSTAKQTAVHCFRHLSNTICCQ